MIEISFRAPDVLDEAYIVCLRRSGNDIQNEIHIEQEIISWIEENFPDSHIGSKSYNIRDNQYYMYFYLDAEAAMALQLRWA